MKIESLEIENFKSIAHINLKHLDMLAVFVGNNGAGKTAIFDTMRFIRECVVNRTISLPLNRRGGFNDLLRRNSETPVIGFKLVVSGKKDPEHKFTYILRIEQSDSTAYVGKEDLTETRKVGRKYENFKIISYRAGKGYIADPKKEKRELQNTDIALGKLGEFSEYKLANAFRNYVANWYFADFFVNTMRDESLDLVDTSKLREDCRNLREVLMAMQQENSEAYKEVVKTMNLCIADIQNIGATKQGNKTHLQISDTHFKNPFSELSVSDGTLKLLAYITLLAQSEKISFLMVEHPETHIYSETLSILFELFEAAAFEGLQTFLSMHSPDFIKNTDSEGVVIVARKNGITNATKMVSNKLLQKYVSSVGIVEAWRDGGLFSI